MLLNLAEKFKLNDLRMIRLGSSNDNEALNKKYSLDHLSGANNKKGVRDDAVDEAKDHLMR